MVKFLRKSMIGAAVTGVLIIAVIAGIIGMAGFSRGVGASDLEEGIIAYVNLEELFEAHPDKALAEEKLNLEARELQQELEEKADELSQEEQQQMLQEYQQILSEREQELIEGVLQQIEGLIIELAEEKGFQVVLNGQNVLYGGYNLTPDIIDRMEDEV